MKARVFLLFIALVLSSCQLKEQAEELQALKHCTYEVVSADSVYLSNIDVTQLVKENKLDLINAPQLAFSYIQKKMPLNAVVNLKITNPGTQEAAINEFEYIVMIKDTEIMKGFFDKEIRVPANGGTTIVPVELDKDIYPLISNPANQSAVSNFFGSPDEKKTIVILKIKPSIAIGGEMVKYPDYITVDKPISNKTILAYIGNLNKNSSVSDTSTRSTEQYEY